MTIIQKLNEHADAKYAKFQLNLCPGVEPESCIGVRVPDVRKIAKELYKENNYSDFLSSLPHKLYDENMLHGVLISELKDFDECIKQVEQFLPYVDNWAVCDIMSPKIFKKNKEKLLPYIKKWAKSKHVYTCRFALEMLMSFYLDDDFKPEYLEISASVCSNEYYVNMMVAWFFATALTKQWASTIPYIENKRLSDWTHNKTIQKSKESYRITEDQKLYLNTLKV